MAEKVDRLTRVNALLKREIANLLERDLLSESGILVSIPEVRASVDLRNATVSVSMLGGDPAGRRRVMERLREERVEIQHRLAKTLGFKHTPVLEFRQDRRTEQGDRVLAILQEAEASEASGSENE